MFLQSLVDVFEDLKSGVLTLFQHASYLLCDQGDRPTGGGVLVRVAREPRRIVDGGC